MKVLYRCPLLVRIRRRQLAAESGQPAAGRDYFVGAAFSRDLKEQSGVTALAITVERLRVSK